MLAFQRRVREIHHPAAATPKNLLFTELSHMVTRKTHRNETAPPGT